MKDVISLCLLYLIDVCYLAVPDQSQETFQLMSQNIMNMIVYLILAKTNGAILSSDYGLSISF